MDDLFEKLKAEPPVNKSKEEPTEPELSLKKNTGDVPLSEKTVSPLLEISSSKSNTPIEVPTFLKNLEDSNSEPSGNNERSSSSESDSKYSGAKKADNSTEILDTKKTRKMQMPTKAQQKLFETPKLKSVESANVTKKTTAAKEVKEADDNAKNLSSTTHMAKSIETKFKRCYVKIKRENLAILSEKFAREQAGRKPNKNKAQQNKKESSKKALQRAGAKRKAETGHSPPTKKEKHDAKISGSSSPCKISKSSGFFIKLSSNLKKSPPSPKEIRNTSHTSTPFPDKKQSNKSKKTSLSPSKKHYQTTKEKVLRKAAPRIPSNTQVYTTKATKFTRTQLIRTFGKRYFNSWVRIERCRHPMMLTFESNALARKLQAKNKSKNLSVSFKEQVEIIGLSDTESYESDEVNVTANRGDEKLLAGATPLHLKKVENGKVVDDIEFESILFGEPNPGKNSSTPLRKKKENKSYSPLKDDSSSSARSELLKLANEKLPPSALRRLSVDDEDDEDDECEWIVPIEIPGRRSSCTNSTSENDGKITSDRNDEDVVASTDNVPSEENPKEKAPSKEIEVNTSFENKIPEQANSDETVENGKTLNDEEKPRNEQVEKPSDDISQNNFPPLLLESESTKLNSPPLSPKHLDTSDSNEKTVTDKLSANDEKSTDDCIEETSLKKTLLEFD